MWIFFEITPYWQWRPMLIATFTYNYFIWGPIGIGLILRPYADFIKDFADLLVIG